MVPTYTVSQRHVALSAQDPVRAVPVRLTEAVPPHDHDYTEIAVVTRGRVRHRTPGGPLILHAGSVVVTLPGACHAFDEPRDCELYNLYFLGEWFSGDLALLRDAPAAFGWFFGEQLFGRRREIEPMTFELGAEGLRQAERELVALAVPERTAGTVLRLGFLKLLAVLATTGEGMPKWAARAELWRALRLLERELHRGARLTVGDWAKSCGMSEDRFRREFSATFGLSPLDYMNRRRVDFAGRLLLQPGATATRVAHEMGFSDAAHFTRNFVRVKGLTPGAFRRRYLAG